MTGGQSEATCPDPQAVPAREQEHCGVAFLAASRGRTRTFAELRRWLRSRHVLGRHDFFCPGSSRGRNIWAYGDNHDARDRFSRRASTPAARGRWRPDGMGRDPRAASRPPAAHGRASAGPPAQRTNRSVGRAPGGVPPGGAGTAEIPGASRTAVFPLAPLVDRDVAPARAPPAPGNPGAGRRA